MSFYIPVAVVSICYSSPSTAGFRVRMLAVFSLLCGERTHSFHRSFTTATLVHSLNERGYGIYAGQQRNTPGTDVAGSLLPNGMPPGVAANDRTDHEQVRYNDVQKTWLTILLLTS